MPPKRSSSNNNNKKRPIAGVPSKFKQDIIGILLVAAGVFIFISNISSAAGAVGFFVVNQALRSAIGIGVYALPFFAGVYGLLLLIRHEVRELTIRLTGLLVMFVVFITSAQFAYPAYFYPQTKYEFIKGAGGAIGFGMRFLLEKTIGLAGAYVFLFALSIIAVLLTFNITLRTLISMLVSLFRLEKGATPAQKSSAHQVGTQMPLLKDMSPVEKEVIPAPPPPLPPVEINPAIEFPLPKHDAEASKSKGFSKYKLPPIDLLEEASAAEKQKMEGLRKTTELRQKLLEDALRSFGVGARVVSIFQGPAVTRYELQPEPGVKVSKIAGLADDIALNLASQGVRIEAPVLGKSVVGIEVPNATVTPVRIRDIVKTNNFQSNASKLFIAIGKDLAGTPIYGDLSKMPHLLIAGTTGSGKSVCINSLITSILLRARPDEVKMLMIDPKMVELSMYDGIAHLLAPVVTNPKRAAVTLKEWVIKEMERRYKLFHDTGVRNVQAYNQKFGGEESLPYILVIIDELADLMMVAATEVEMAICRIAQLARATGIHLIIATQRPSVDVITGLIKANIPSRIAFAVATQIDSRVVLDSSGAEKLLGRGDMLYNPIGAMKPIRVQGCFVTDKETEKIINFVKEQAEPEYLEEIVGIQAVDFGKENKEGEKETGTGQDALFNDVANLILESGQASTSYIQRKFRIGYNRAARLMDEMEAAGIVSAPEGELKTRRILANREMLKTQ